SSPDERRLAEREYESLNAGKWVRGVKRYLNDLEPSVHQNRANRYCFLGGNPAQDCDERSALQTYPKQSHPCSFRAAFQLCKARESSPRRQRSLLIRLRNAPMPFRTVRKGSDLQR